MYLVRGRTSARREDFEGGELAPFRSEMIDARQEGIAKIARSKNPRLDSDDLYRKLLEGLPAAFYVTDAQGFLSFYNEAAADLWGRRPKLGTDRWCGFWKLF